MARGFILALQFLTRLPVPALAAYQAMDLSRSARWFPLVGMIVGAIVAVFGWLGAWLDPSQDAWLAALLAWCAWIWVTGGLHLDGLADLADALGASHRDRSRFLEVLRDPHLGTFGVLALVVATTCKLVLILVILRRAGNLWTALPLIAAWARLGPLIWSQWLPALGSATAERFAWHSSTWLAVLWAIGLAAASSVLQPGLLLAPLAIFAWGLFLKRTVGGVTGDCLGAGIETLEVALLLLVIVSGRLAGSL